MASIIIRNLDAATEAQLRVRATHRRRSMEEEACDILREVLAKDATAPRDLGKAIGARFRTLGGVDLKIPAREVMREPPAPAKAARK